MEKKKMDYKLNTAENEYAKDATVKREDILHLVDWVQKQPHLPNITEYQVIQMYYVSDHSLSRTKRLIETHYKFKNEAPEFFNGLDFQPPKYHHSYWDIIYTFDSPVPTPEGYRLVYFGLKDSDTSKYHVEVGTAMLIKIMMVLVLEKGICPGTAIVIDLEGSTWGHLTTLSMSYLRKFMYYIQYIHGATDVRTRKAGVRNQNDHEGYTMAHQLDHPQVKSYSEEGVATRVKIIHVIHMNSLVEKVLSLIKPMMKKELMNMIQFHASMDTFYNLVPRECMPTDLGGTLPKTRAQLSDGMREKVDALDGPVRRELALRTNEKLRPVDVQKHNESIIPNESFRKLAID